MPIFEATDPNTGLTIELESEDSTPPTEEELNQVFGSIAPKQPLFKEAQFDPIAPSEKLNFVQELVYSFAPDDQKEQYLQEQFPNSKIDFDEEKGFVLDGAAVNPQGFDLGDLSRNASKSFSLAGQVAGSILGFGASIPTTGGTAGIPGAGRSPVWFLHPGIHHGGQGATGR